MRKMWKKVMTIILALVMTLGLGTSVQAAALQNGENTNSTNVTITGLPAGKTVTFTTYQVIKTKFDTAANELTYHLTDWAKAVLVTTGGKTEDAVIEDISKLTTTGASTTEQNDIVNQLAAAASKTAYSAATWTVSSDKTTATANLPIGSYLVVASCTDMTFLNMLVSVNAKADSTNPNGWTLEGKGAVLKGNSLSVDKKITGKKGAALQAPIDETTAAIGDTLSYTVTADVPHYPANAIHTRFKVKDTPTNLEIKQSSVKVYGVKADGTETELTDQFTPALDGNGVLTVDMSAKYLTLFCANGTYPYATVKITYDAVLMESASIATGNTNKPALIYGTDPYTDSDANDEEIPGDGKQKVYTYGLNLTKKNSDNAALSNAVFSVKRKDNDTNNDTKLKFIEDATAKGTYTLAKDQEAAGATDQLTTNDQGTFNIKGLDANVEYVLEETKAPSGYFRNHGSVAFTITPEANAEGKLTGAIKSVAAKDEKGTALDNAGAWTCGIDQNKTAYVAVTLKDTKIPFLPATGGMGTVIFTIVGDALMILAIVLFIRSRKGRKEDR